jgi:hypothetical protein
MHVTQCLGISRYLERCPALINNKSFKYYIEQERRGAEDKRKKIRLTFKEFIYARHTLLLTPLYIQIDKRLNIYDSVISPKNKPCLILLKP